MALDTLPILVVIGGGGIGLATALRLGAAHHVLLASRSQSTLTAGAEALKKAGHKFTTQQVDITSYPSVAAVAKTVASLGGAIDTVVLTSGISPSMGSLEQILKVDVLGTANVIAAFSDEIDMPRGSNLICVGSAAGRMCPPLGDELEKHLATAPLGDLLENKQLWDAAADFVGMAYCVAKRANVLRVEAAASMGVLAARGVRVNCVSPGAIETNMLRVEMAAEWGDGVKAMIELTPLKRAGNAEEVAEAVEFVARCGYVNGTDVLIDGGSTAVTRWVGPIGGK
ncbi:short-chain dehydrogenase/reductase SDR [Colletotrichum plurivorum]|uniref:Short-chain dehydrogenase/reductase SDR n=1 Tax=Colletotrichum plurivorum TaxID=2175906 RepID=A0A8H6JE75_9PEZI|nr:short-chain dehydrogenase/reductase SDR [Colletotrichum plurivorum]